jgi:uncharacterized protein YecT (DUF1311 family)
MRRMLLVLVLTALSPPGIAGATDCAHATTQAAMNACAAQAYSASDVALNAAYRQIMARLRDNEASRHLLQTAQRAWIGYRDAACAFAASASDGGSVHGMIVTQCVDDLTRVRVKALQAYLHCAEGDLSCPVPPR